MNNQYIYLHKNNKNHTTYKITISKKTRNVFDQTTDKSTTIDIEIRTTTPHLFVPGHNMFVLDPASKPRYSIHSINHNTIKIRMYRIRPKNYKNFRTFEQHHTNKRNPPKKPGKRVFNKTMSINKKINKIIKTILDLNPTLQNKFKQMFVIIEPTKQPNSEYYRKIYDRWIQVTKLTINKFHDKTNITTWATSLLNERPLEGTRVNISPNDKTHKSDSDDLVRIPLKKRSSSTESTILIVQDGENIALLPEHSSY